MSEDIHELNKRKWLAELAPLVKRMSPDELAISRAFVGKLMSEGVKEYGPLDVKTDKRSLLDLVDNAIDEGIDSVSYLQILKRTVEVLR